MTFNIFPPILGHEPRCATTAWRKPVSLKSYTKLPPLIRKWIIGHMFQNRSSYCLCRRLDGKDTQPEIASTGRMVRLKRNKILHPIEPLGISAIWSSVEFIPNSHPVNSMHYIQLVHEWQLRIVFSSGQRRNHGPSLASSTRQLPSVHIRGFMSYKWTALEATGTDHSLQGDETRNFRTISNHYSPNG